MKEYKTIVNQLGRTMKLKALDPMDKKTLYNMRRKYYNKIKKQNNNKQ